MTAKLSPGATVYLATDDICGIGYPLAKLTFGNTGTATNVSADNPLPVSLIGGGSSSGGLTDAELRATPVTISGTVSVGTVPVTGSFYQATQPISAAALPLPSGASTETTLAALSTKTPALGQAAMAASSPVVIASNQTAVPVSGTFFQATQPVSGTVSANVSGTVQVSGTFWQATQPISGTVTANAGTGTFAVSGPLTDTQLRAAAVPVSGTFYPVTQPVSIASMPSTPVTGTFWQATQPISGTVSISGTVPVSGTFWQATQPVSIAATVTVSGPLTDTQLRASAVPISIASMPSTPVTGTFWQATQPVSIAATVNVAQSGTWNIGTLTSITNAVAVTAPTLTKGTQAANGFSVQELKDAGRSCLAMTAEFTFAQTAETLLTMTVSVDGAATTTFSSRAITSSKKLRLQSVDIEVESLGSGTAPQRAYLRLRRNTAGATTASSSLQAVWGCVNNAAIVKSAAFAHYEIPDAFEMNGDGTATFGFTLETPDWVTSTATGRAKITVIGYEF